MILTILGHTPVWVWVLFCALTALGLAQTRRRDVGRARAILLPILMVILSLSGSLNTFTQVPVALVAWLAAFWLTFSLAGEAVAVRGASWSPASRHFHIPGSWLPLGLILGLFAIKYVTGVCLSLNRALAASTGLTTLLSLTYGTFAGLFWGRAWSLLRLALRSRTVQSATAL